MTTQALPEDQPACNDAESLLEDCDCGENELAAAISKLESITAIHRNAGLHKKNLMSKFDTIRHLCVLRFLQKTQEDPRSRMSSSKQIAESIFGPEKGTDYKARCIRIWSEEFVKTLTLAPYKQGKHQKSESLIDDPDIRGALISILRSKRAELIEARSFSRWIKEELHLNESLGLLQQIVVSESTARRWLHILGFRLTERKNGVYIDGHEREDVVAYRKEWGSVIDYG
jgi:hypothetical protein